MKIRPRKPKIDVSAAPLHWVANDAQTTHTVNVLSLLLPAGEQYFVALFKGALPYVEDAALRADVRGFIGQEAQHAGAHQKVIDYLVASGIDVEPFTRRVEWIFERPLADAPFGFVLPKGWERSWLRRRIGVVAAIEHFTTMLGAFMLEAEPLHRASADGEMIRLLMWHAAEEVEHRSVAFDLYEVLGGSYRGRIAGMCIVVPTLTYFWVEGVRFMMKNDPTEPGPANVLRFVARGEEGIMPTFGSIGRAITRYLRRDHHPRDEHAPANTARVLAEHDPVPARA